MFVTILEVVGALRTSKLFVYEHSFRWGDFAAAALLSGLPITVVFLLAQRWMISGLAAGGVKG